MNRCISLFITCLATTAAGCAGDTNSEAVKYTRRIETCEMKPFEATVKSGPKAGLKLEGTLMMGRTESSGENLVGMYYSGKPGEALAVTGTLTDKAIGLNFKLPDGTIIQGIGPHADQLNLCSGQELVGDLIYGPDAQGISTGDWRVRADGRQNLGCNEDYCILCSFGPTSCCIFTNECNAAPGSTCPENPVYQGQICF